MTTSSSSPSSSSTVEIRRLRKSDEAAIESLLVDDVYHWRQWISISLQHGLLTLFPSQICLVFVVVGVLVWLLLSSMGAVIAVWVLLLFLIFLVSWIIMAGIIRFVQAYPEFKERNLTESYEEEGCAFFVAVVEGRIVGCVGAKKKNDQEASLYRMAVSSSCQGLGVGRSLVQAVVDFSKEQNFQTIILYTSHIIQAHRFYQKVGFVISNEFNHWHYRIIPNRVYEMVRNVG